MGLSFKFAIVSDLHIALPHTIWNHPERFHLVEFSIPALEVILADLSQLDLDFLLLPGDLTQHGEPENHAWLAQRLAQLPYPVYVIPGNHDVPTAESLNDFAGYYPQFGYKHTQHLYYECEVLPHVRLIGLNSNCFNAENQQIGWIDQEQLDWLQTILQSYKDDLILATIHHNVLEHLPNQAKNPLGRRYMLGNAEVLCEVLHQARVKLVFTGHLHIQDIAYSDRFDLYDITTGSIVSYPHPYRILKYEGDLQEGKLEIQSHQVKSVPDYPDLLHFSREWMGDLSHSYMMKLLTHAPLNMSVPEAAALTPELRYFWATLAAGDARFQFPQFPRLLRTFFESFSSNSSSVSDNNVTLSINGIDH